MADLTADFELGTNGNTVLAADAGSATAWNTVDAPPAGGTLAYDTAHAAHGAQAVKIATGGTTGVARMWWIAALGTQTDHYGRLYLYMTANPAVTQRVVRMASGASLCAGIEVTTTGKVRISDSAAVAQATSSTSIALNQWVRIEYHIIHSTTVGQGEVKLFNTANSTTPTETLTTAATINTRASCDRTAFGINLSATNVTTFWLDDILAGAVSYPGPAVIIQTGVGIANNAIGSGAKAVSWSKTGAGINNSIGSGASTPTQQDTGAGVINNSIGSGAKAFVEVNSGAGVNNNSIGSGSKAGTLLNKTGVGIIDDLIGSGASFSTQQNNGAGIVNNSIGSGVRVGIINKSSSGIVDFDGFGVRARVVTKSGSGTADLEGHTAVVFNDVNSGASAINDLIGSGTYVLTFVKTSSGITDFNASGASFIQISLTATSGFGISDFVGNGFKVRVVNKTGSGVSNFKAAAHVIRETWGRATTIAAYGAIGRTTLAVSGLGTTQMDTIAEGVTE